MPRVVPEPVPSSGPGARKKPRRLRVIQQPPLQGTSNPRGSSRPAADGASFLLELVRSGGEASQLTGEPSPSPLPAPAGSGRSPSPALPSSSLGPPSARSPALAVLRASGLGLGLTWVAALVLLMLGRSSPVLAMLLYALSCGVAARVVLHGRVGLGALSGALVGVVCTAVSLLREPGLAAAAGAWLALLLLGAAAGAVGSFRQSLRPA